ncbi:hypothetical protein [Streptomyces sp. WAC01280]|uniref:hypothetical protein n=1 Tax=Streptomyces sp. WAC01280 TaxID=2487424 RepID=UPI000F7A1142|nr:hypothetical protein [Streptomyces sp. WAC01280]RSS59811.1 hypothetical protein EF909_08090 [Streptomyces sp. WAC01280]
MSAPAVEAATVPVPTRRLVAAGIRRGSSGLQVEYPQMSAAASHVRPARPVALNDEERKELSDKVREVNKRSSGR